jgi:hypothetical protein
MNPRLHPIVGALAFSGVFVTGMLTAGSAAAAQRAPSTGDATPHRGPHCDNSQFRGDEHDYQGLSVSALYDALFHPGPAMPYLHSYIPQSLATWHDWDGQGNDLLLLGEYGEHEDSYLVGINPDSGAVLGTVRVAPSHLGGMAFLGSWLFTGDNPWPHRGSPTVTRYPVDRLRSAMREAIDNGDRPYVRSDGPRQNIHATDFMVADGHSMYTGNHGNPIDGIMYRYRLTDDGWLKEVDGPWSVPPRAQGMVVTPDRFIFSSDNGSGRGWLTVVDRDEPSRVVSCIWVPSMPEDIERYNGRLVMAFESGTARYSRNRPTNRITRLHIAPLAPLLALTDPAALADDPTLGGLLRARSGSGSMADYQTRRHDVDHLLAGLQHKHDARQNTATANHDGQRSPAAAKE